MKHHQLSKKAFALFTVVVLIFSVHVGILVLPTYANEVSGAPVNFCEADEPLEKADTSEPFDKTKAEPTEGMKPPAVAEERGTLVSEIEVNTFLVRFYDQDGTLLHEVTGVKGSAIEEPEHDPQQEGLVFSHWYLVDENLQGDAPLPYDFEQAITGLTYLKAQYLPEQQELDPAEDSSEESPIAEDAIENTANEASTQESPENSEEEPIELSEPSQDNNEEARIQLSVILAVEGEEIQDGAYQALLTGEDLPEEGLMVANVGEAFFFPELVFTAGDVGTHFYYIEALVEEPLPLHTYDLKKQEVRVDVLVQQDGHVNALVSYPEGADHLLIVHSVNKPTVRVYVNLLPGQIINYGDEVVFTAKMEGCGEFPRIQWQYSPDNETWTDIAGGTNAELAVLITPSNATGYWRVAVTITD